VIREIRRHPDLADLCKLSDAELRERSQQVLKHLGYWISAGHEAEIEQSYELLGKARFEESIPLHETVRALAIIKNKMMDFVHYQGIAMDGGGSVRGRRIGTPCGALFRRTDDSHGARLRNRMASGRARCRLTPLIVSACECRRPGPWLGRR